MPEPVSLSKDDLLASIAEALQLGGGAGLENEDSFWQELATSLNLPTTSKARRQLVEAVFKKLELAWDDEFLDEHGGFTLPLYEALEDAAKAYDATQHSSEAVEEEQDDESLADYHQEKVPPTTFGLETVYHWIRDGILVLNPEWQRDFVWKSKKMKRFIESILLGLPIPSFLIFVDAKSGKKFVIDGRQRLETIARFCGPREQRGQPRVRFRTFAKTEPGWGPEEQLGDAEGKYYEQLDDRFKSRFNSAHLVIFEFSNIALASLYQVFKRYNTGAVALNAAEIRNAVYQASPLHAMLFRLAGEQRPRSHVDDEERHVTDDLRETMQRKVQRYGAYDFVGRYFAFAYAERGSVAKATLDFMDKFEGAGSGEIEALRREFVRGFKTAKEWYEAFLTDPAGDRFHAFLATLQLVSTTFVLRHVDAGRAEMSQLRACIGEHWEGFAANRLARKQNSTLFWGSQKTWVSVVEAGLHLPLTYQGWDWEADLESLDDKVVG